MLERMLCGKFFVIYVLIFDDSYTQFCLTLKNKNDNVDLLKFEMIHDNFEISI